jgi:hypothetical protein
LPGGPVGEPDAANPHVRFDERDLETEYGYTISCILIHRARSRLYLVVFVVHERVRAIA